MAILNLQLEHARFTRDIDLLGYINNTIPEVERIIRDILETPVVDDGLTFDTESVRGTVIKPGDEYSGVRVKFDASLGTTKLQNLQVDIGVGDIVYPKAELVRFQGLLDFPEATVRVYSPETILAEKIHAVVRLGWINSRMKDLFDIWLIASSQEIDGLTLSKALQTTFKARETPIPEALVVFDQDFLTPMRRRAWRSIGSKLQTREKLPDLVTIIEQLKPFIAPVLISLYKSDAFLKRWHAEEEWAWQ
jgi:predicted nucleotidyltransferase component of viral defense system